MTTRVARPPTSPAYPVLITRNVSSKTFAAARSHTVATRSEPGELLDTFKARYPATGNEIWVSTAGNDGASGTLGSPKRTIAGAIAASSASSQIRVMAGTYNDGNHNWSGKNGNATNWIHLRLEPGAHVIGNGDGAGVSQLQNCSFIAIWGGEWSGLNHGGVPYELGHLAQFGAHSLAVWGGTYHDFSSHAFASLNAPGRYDVCYNRCYRLANWNFFQTSAISTIGMTDSGVAAWPDGYQNHFFGNVIDQVWIEPSTVGGQQNITDGNGLIFDYSTSFTGKTLVGRNLIVGCGARGIHALGTPKVDAWCNTSVDNEWNLYGSWISEYSIHDSPDCHFAWNVACSRPGNNVVGTLYNPSGTSTWSDTVYLRGVGGEDSVSPGVNQYNNVDKTGVGPANYFNNYQPGVHTQPSITSVAGFRPKLAQVAKFTPPSPVRNALSIWPDALGVLPPGSGDWAYGAFEAV